MKATEEKKQLEKQKEDINAYIRKGDDQIAYEYFIDRKKELKDARQNVLGVNIEKIWRSADKAYVPHTLSSSKGTKGFASDDEEGWRSTPVTFNDTKSWMEDSVPVTPYSKMNTALSILVDKNPSAVFKATMERFEAANTLHENLYKRNWDIADSKEQLKVIVINAAKYGIFCGHTAPLKVQRKVRNLVKYDPTNPSKNEYEEIIHTVYDDVYRWALNPWTTWFDDMAKAGDVLSMNDWMRYKDFSWEAFREQFASFKNFKYVAPKKVPDSDETDQEKKANIQKANTVRVWYYENLTRDMFFVTTDDGVVIINEPIPRNPENKRLSCWVAPWSIRHQDTIYGIGPYEAMRNDYKVYMKVRNMTIDQLVLSIYKEWFYEGTSNLQNDGTMKISPGTGRQVTNAKNIVWNTVPGPGREAWEGMAYLEKKMDDATGISKTLEGELSPKAKAFDIAQAREAALKRMKTPLDNLAFALEQDAYITIGLFQELYSVPEIEKITDPKQIAEYRAEISQGSIPANQVAEAMMPSPEMGGEEIMGLEVSRYRQFPLNIERDADGNILQTKEEKFFEINPSELPWEGKISITGQSIVPESPMLAKQTKLEMANILLPLFEKPPEIYLPSVKQILKVYNADPEDWLPITWLQLMQGEQPAPEKPQLIVPMGGKGQQQGQQQGGQQGGQNSNRRAEQANRVIPSTTVEPKSTVSRFMSRLNPFS